MTKRQIYICEDGHHDRRRVARPMRKTSDPYAPVHRLLRAAIIPAVILVALVIDVALDMPTWAGVILLVIDLAYVWFLMFGEVVDVLREVSGK